MRSRTRALHTSPKLDLVEPKVSVLVALRRRKLGDVLGRDDLGQPLRENGDSVRPPAGESLDDRSGERVHDRLQRDDLASELLGDERERRAGGLADAEREMAGLSSHGHDEVPAPRGLRVHHQVVHDLDPDRARGLVPERPDVGGQVEIVVDRLRHVNDAQPAPGGARELVRGEGGVVAADRQEHADPEAIEGLEHTLHVLRTSGGVCARDADARTAAEVDPARVFDGESNDVRDVSCH